MVMTENIQPIIDLCDGDRNSEILITNDFYYECANKLTTRFACD